MDALLSRDGRCRFVCKSDPAVQAVINAVYERKLGDDVIYAYMAETYPLLRDAENWRRLSGTRNGVYVALFLNTLHAWDAWVVDVARELPGTMLSPVQRLFIAWIQGRLPAKFHSRAPELAQVAELRLIGGFSQEAPEDVAN